MMMMPHEAAAPPPQQIMAMPPSPNGVGPRRFMQDLRPGPSEEQRRYQAEQKERLAADLREQIRQKQEREARAKAERLAAQAKVMSGTAMVCRLSHNNVLSLEYHCSGSLGNLRWK